LPAHQRCAIREVSAAAIHLLWIRHANVSWFDARDALVCMCGCELFGALAHNTRTCHHVVCAQSDLPQTDCKRICNLRFASVAPLRAGAETDAESPALDSAHGSERLSALALSAGSQRWLSALALSTWTQRVASARVSQRWLSLRGSHDDGTATTTKTNDDDDDNDKDNDDDDKNNDDDDNNDNVDKNDDNEDDDHNNNNVDNDNGVARGGAVARRTVLTTHKNLRQRQCQGQRRQRGRQRRGQWSGGRRRSVTTNKDNGALKSTCLCVIMTYQPDMANMLPTSQFLMVFFHVICHVVSLIADMSAIQQPAVGERHNKRGGSVMREVSAAVMQQRTTR
jgi:hypothetical protein